MGICLLSHFQSQITYYKSRYEVYNDEFYVLYYDSRYQTRDWTIFGPKRRWNANNADIALGPVYKERGLP